MYSSFFGRHGALRILYFLLGVFLLFLFSFSSFQHTHGPDRRPTHRPTDRPNDRPSVVRPRHTSRHHHHHRTRSRLARSLALALGLGLGLNADTHRRLFRTLALLPDLRSHSLARSFARSSFAPPPSLLSDPPALSARAIAKSERKEARKTRERERERCVASVATRARMRDA